MSLCNNGGKIWKNTHTPLDQRILSIPIISLYACTVWSECAAAFEVYILILLHSERPKLHRVLAVLSAIGLIKPQFSQGRQLKVFCFPDRLIPLPIGTTLKRQNLFSVTANLFLFRVQYFFV